MAGPKVFGIGLSKTGTTALYAALMRLGIKTITWRHMKFRGLDEWRRGDFTKDYLTGVRGATDLPIGTYFRELDARYPGSKFILTERPLEPWLVSVKEQFEKTDDPDDIYRRDVLVGTYGFSSFNAMRYEKVFKDHYAGVRAHFADRPEQLLIMNFFEGDGWEKLCAFLDKPVPNEPFPNVKPGYRAPLWKPDGSGPVEKKPKPAEAQKPAAGKKEKAKA